METLAERKSLWNLRKNDVITSDKESINLFGKKWCIEELEFDIKKGRFEQECLPEPKDIGKTEDMITISNLERDGNYAKGNKIILLHSNSAIDGLILLERLGHKFKVGNKVRFTDKNPTKYLRLMEGEVIVIDPRLRRKSGATYLVFFPKLDSEFVIPGRMPYGHEQPWFPEKHNNPEVYGKAFWNGEVGEGRIEFLT